MVTRMGVGAKEIWTLTYVCGGEGRPAAAPACLRPRPWAMPRGAITARENDGQGEEDPAPQGGNPQGIRDYFGTEVTERTEMLAKIAAVYHRYGFEALESSAVETVEALGKFLPDVDRPNEGVFAWQEGEEDGKGDWLALRYDLTAPLARVYAQHRNDLPTPYRRFAMGPVWRNEKPGPGASASSISAMRIPWARPPWPPMPRSAPCWPTAWKRSAFRAATTSSGSTTGRF